MLQDVQDVQDKHRMNEPCPCRHVFGAKLRSRQISIGVLFADFEMAYKVLPMWGHVAGILKNQPATIA